MRSTRATAGIVTFNPDIPRLRENLQSVLAQVEKAVVVDNGSSNIELVELLLADFPQVTLKANASNLGIARALNQIMEWASKSAQWVILLDQDTVASGDLVELLEAHTGDKVAVVAPTVVDRSQENISPSDAGVSIVDYCITSGALYNVGAWRAVGGYDEAMFIDFVDFDYCLRAGVQGYQILRESKAVILHEIGRITRHGRLIAYHHSSFRSYHMARDMIYYSKKHRNSPVQLRVQKRGVLFTYLVLCRKVLIVALFEEDRIQRIAALIRGIASGTFRKPSARNSHH
ncbi:glycosyltransferase family 2 protein [Arthrobacter sp. Z1-9]